MARSRIKTLVKRNKKIKIIFKKLSLKKFPRKFILALFVLLFFYPAVGFAYHKLHYAESVLLPSPREYLRQRCEENRVDFAILDSIVYCESNWRMVKNSSSTAYGYFQILDGTEQTTPMYAEGRRKYDPYTNIDMGIFLYQRDGWYPWAESRHCWWWRYQAY